MTTVEAMANGCVPVVIGKAGPGEIVQDAVNGFKWNCLNQLKEQTLKLIRDDDNATYKRRSKMTISELYVKMLKYPDNEMHDINHLTKVWAYARTIGVLESLDKEIQFITEAAAIVHDIACPSLRKLYGEANGKKQEETGPALAMDFFKDTDLSEDQKERLCFLIAHHHTPQEIDGIDYQILIEADYLVNADEAGFSRESIQNMYDMYFKTSSGRDLLKSLFLEKSK